MKKKYQTVCVVPDTTQSSQTLAFLVIPNSSCRSYDTNTLRNIKATKLKKWIKIESKFFKMQNELKELLSEHDSSDEQS